MVKKAAQADAAGGECPLGVGAPAANPVPAVVQRPGRHPGCGRKSYKLMLGCPDMGRGVTHHLSLVRGV